MSSRKESKDPATRRLVQAVDRALHLLELLSEDDEGYRLTDLAERSGLSPSTAHRLLTTMAERRFVQFDATDGMWHVGRQSFSVGSTFIRRRNYVAQVLPFLRQLRDETRETVNLSVPDSGHIVILAQIESREIVRAITRPGGRAAMTSSGMGKAILAYYSDEDVAQIIQSFGMPRLTPQSITRPRELKVELRSVRLLGYAFDNEEAYVGLRCVAAPLFNEAGEPFAAISISGPSPRVTIEKLKVLGPIVREMASRITDALGGRAIANNQTRPD